MVATPEWFGVRARLFRFAYIAPPVSFRLYIYRDDDEWPRLNTDSIRGNPCQSLSSLYLDTKGDTYDPQNCIKLWHVKFDQCGTSICTIRRSNPLTQMYKILSQIKGWDPTYGKIYDNLTHVDFKRFSNITLQTNPSSVSDRATL